MIAWLAHLATSWTVWSAVSAWSGAGVLAGDTAATCVVADAPVLARAQLAGVGAVELVPAAVRAGGRVVTRCDGLPGAHPTALVTVGDRVAVGFRDRGVHLWDGATFTAVAGLPRAPVRALAATGARLWIATGTDGVWVSDGGEPATRFEHRTLGARGITAIAADRRGRVHVGVDPRGWWVIDARGRARRHRRAALVGCFDEDVGAVRAVAPGSCPRSRPSPSTVPAHVTALAVHRGALHVGTLADGVFVADGDGVAGELAPIAGAPAMVNALLSAGDDLYIATPKGLYRRRGEGAPARLDLGLPSEHVNGLARGSADTLWIATGAGLVGWSRDSGRIRVLGTGHGLPSRIVYAVAETEDGAVWAGTAAGVARLGGGGVTLYGQSTGALPHDWITSLVADGTEVVAGTYDAGVARLFPGGRGAAVEAFGAAWINPHGLVRVGSVWLAATLGEGLLVVRDGAAAPSPVLPSDDVTAAVAYRGRVWVGTRAGLAYLGS